MKNIPWVGLGALAVLLTLPATAPAMGEDSTSASRARRVTVFRADSNAATGLTEQGSALRRDREVAPLAEATPTPLDMNERAPESLDVELVTGFNPHLPEASEFHALDLALIRVQPSAETRAIIRAEAACTHMLDLEIDN